MTNPTPDIRPTAAADTPAIAAIAEATGLFPGHMLAAMAAGYLDGSKPDIWLTASTGGQPVGFCFCEPERLTTGTWNLLAIGVSPAHQACGIGTALLATLESRLRQSAARVLLVETADAPEFAKTRSFYLQRDFAEEARIRAYYDAGLDKLVFWKHL